MLASLCIATTQAQETPGLPYTFTQVGTEYRLTLQTSTIYYYGFLYSGDLTTPWQTVDMALGSPGPTFAYQSGTVEKKAFFRGEGISVFAPRDTDLDGMDDLWELQHPYLDPLDPTDASRTSPNNLSLTNLQEYALIFGLGTQKPQYYSREVSLFNYGAPTATYEAISREQSIFNLGSPLFSVEANSREVSIFNGEHLPTDGYPEAYSREVSAFNFGSPLASVEAIGREVSLFNGEHLPTAGYPEAYSREVSAFNFGSPLASVEAISREVSVLNNIP